MLFLRFVIPIVILAVGCSSDRDIDPAEPSPSDLRNGDLIFQTSTSRQSQAIHLATGSKYSHVGLIYKNGDEVLVLEAVQPVKLTPLVKWIDRGEDDHYVVKRLKNADDVLTTEVLGRMRTIAKTYLGKDYNLHFEWSDERIYCSELVWKLYDEAAGIELSSPERLGNFDLTHPTVRSMMAERYGDRIPQNEPVVSPAALFDSPLLITVR